MRLILLGPPGAGKGTQAARIARRFGVPHVATGDLFRAAIADETPIGKRAKEFMDRGELVPDDVVLDMLRARLADPDTAAGFLLDGFPRTVPQADALERNLADLGHAIDAVVSLEVADEVIVKRLSARRMCPKCGHIYNRLSTASQADGRCDVEGENLVQRDDDRPEVVTKRLDVFHAQTKPVIAYYRERGLLVPVDGVGTVGDVESRITKEIEAQVTLEKR